MLLSMLDIKDTVADSAMQRSSTYTAFYVSLFMTLDRLISICIGPDRVVAKSGHL